RRIGSDAPPVNQDESGARIEAAQGNRRGAHRRVAAVLVVGNRDDVRVNGRNALEKSFGGGLTRFGHRVLVVGVYRVRPDLLGGGNVGSSNDDALCGGFDSRSGWCSRCCWSNSSSGCWWNSYLCNCARCHGEKHGYFHRNARAE